MAQHDLQAQNCLVTHCSYVGWRKRDQGMARSARTSWWAFAPQGRQWKARWCGDGDDDAEFVRRVTARGAFAEPGPGGGDALAGVGEDRLL